MDVTDNELMECISNVLIFCFQLTEYFCGMIEETIKDIGGKGNSSATIKALQLEFERLNWQHSQEMAELRHNTSKKIAKPLSDKLPSSETQIALSISQIRASS